MGKISAAEFWDGYDQCVEDRDGHYADLAQLREDHDRLAAEHAALVAAARDAVRVYFSGNYEHHWFADEMHRLRDALPKEG
jgi:hypothetical protein